MNAVKDDDDVSCPATEARNTEDAADTKCIKAAYVFQAYQWEYQGKGFTEVSRVMEAHSHERAQPLFAAASVEGLVRVAGGARRGLSR